MAAKTGRARRQSDYWLLVTLCTAACCMLGEVKGHGRMITPPSRPSAFRLGWDTPINYDDNQQYCGGREVQRKYGGKCGICGDPWMPVPRPYERPGGHLAKKDDFILSSFHTGTAITANIQITAAHRGYFMFYLCNVDELPNPVEATQECLHKHLLPITSKGGATRFEPVTHGYHEVILQLPIGLVCNHCVLQWKYRAGNDWNNGCLGCGPQEEFYSCADLSITRSDGSLPPTRPPPTAVITTTEDPYHFIPDPLRPNQTEAERDPPTQEMIRFFLCSFCMEQFFQTGSWPQVCIKGNVATVRACPRSLFR